MMDNLTAILCDTSPMMAPQSFTERSIPPQGQNKLSQHSMSSGTVLLDSVSQISNLNASLSSVTHSSPSNINMFSSSDQIHIPSKIDSGFDDRSSVSVFSDSFPEIVPSWLTHDFMKVSDNLNSPGILSNISDIYSTNRENEHLEMLDLGFTPELTSQDVTHNINRSYNDSQKILDNLSVQRYPGNESLLIPSFNDINNTHLHMSMDKNNMQYLKFKQNGPDISSTQSLMKATLPCETELLHLPLPTNLNEQCLNSVSSPSMLSSSQSQSHPADVVCDKLPQINLSHLDSLLGNETSLADIQLLRHDFSNVRSSESNCNPQSNNMCLDSYNANGNILTCNTTNILGSNITPLPQSQDVSVQVNTLVADNFVPSYTNCISCEKVTPDPESHIEVVQCFKCKFCDYVNLHKCAIVSHVNISHSKSPESANMMIRSNLTNALYVGGQSEAHFINANNTASDALSILNSNAKMTNLVSVRSTIQKGSANSHMLQNDTNKNSNRRILPKTTGRTSENNILNNNTLNASQNKVTTANRILPKKPVSKKHNSNNSIFNNPQDNANKNLKQTTLPENSIEMPNHISNLSASQNDVGKIFKKIIAKKPEELPVNNISSMSQTNFNKNSSRVTVSKKPEDASKNHPEGTGNESTVRSNEEKQSSFKKAWQKKITRELGTFICEFKGCNVRFRALDNLEYHKKCHTLNSRTFKCPECQTTMDNWGTMAGHLWRNHGNDMELHACDQCPFRTYSLSRLENLHKRIHTNEFSFLCDTCGKGFKNGKQLTNHRVTHREKRKPVHYTRCDAKCDICSVSFSSRTMLLSHQKSIHYRLKPFSCNYCDYSASKKSTVNLHMRLHTGEKPFKCDSCDYQTHDHNTLRRHKMRHSGEKQYKCVLCSYRCTTSHYYKTHLKKKHPESEGLVFSCNLCNFNTIKQEIYLSHLYKHEHSHVNSAPKENSLTDLQTTDEIFPFAEAMNNGFSDSDNIFSDINISKTMQSFSNCLNINMMSVGQQGAD